MSDLDIIADLEAKLRIRLPELSNGLQTQKENNPYFSVVDGNVTELNLSRITLGNVPESITRLSSLRLLRLYNCGINSLPAGFENLNSLECLYLASNEFNQIPSAIWKLESLRILGLNKNRITKVPSDISKLLNLEKIGLSFNKLNELPEALRYCEKLRSLFIDKNNFEYLPQAVSGISSLEELGLSGNTITVLPSSLTNLTKLKLLSLGETELREPCEVIFEITSLNKLDLKGTSIYTVPTTIGSLNNLRWLDLSGTRIRELPASFIHLQGLVHLDCSSTRLGNFPAQVTKLKNLNSLNLSGVRIGKITSGLSNLKKLISIDLSNTGMLSFPSELCGLKELRLVNLQGNRISQLPEDVINTGLRIHWKKINKGASGVFVRGNPLNSPPPEIISKGNMAIANYFQSIRGAQRPIEELKLLIVGEGGAGKTSLANRLLGERFNENEPQTHGINLRYFTLDPKNRNQIKVNLWDFGGQEVMHATHQFFLSRRSAYILVLDGRKDERAEYWLKHIRSFGGDSPIFVVLNKSDENASFDVNRKFLSEKYPSIVGFMKTSCKNADGISELKLLLSRNVVKAQLTSTLWAENWFVVKEALESMDSDYLHYTDYQNMCISQGIMDSEEQEALIDFLHDLGVALHFKDLPLRDTNVINPRWITDGVYRLINSQAVANKAGILEFSDLDSLLDPAQHPRGKHNFIIELMRKFELCYSLREDSVLIPTLLPIEEPRVRFTNENLVRFRIVYDFLPKSVVPRLIVRMHDDIEGQLRWRTGVVFKNDELESRGYLRADEAERKIELRVSGSRRREYAGIILHAIREISDTFELLKYSVHIPMPDRPNITISYNHLVVLESKGIRAYIPDGSTREYSVSELLGSIKPEEQSLEDVLEVLGRIAEQNDTVESLMKKANDTVLLQPNFFGVGLNLNNVVEKFMSKRKKEDDSLP